MKKIVLRRHHGLKLNMCSREVVGSSDKIADSRRLLSELLFGLEELTFGGFPAQRASKPETESCGMFINFILPSAMHTILRFE